MAFQKANWSYIIQFRVDRHNCRQSEGQPSVRANRASPALTFSSALFDSPSQKITRDINNNNITTTIITTTTNNNNNNNSSNNNNNNNTPLHHTSTGTLYAVYTTSLLDPSSFDSNTQEQRTSITTCTKQPRGG
ncbi:hypothetical protein K457DRAFT_377087 [Linnemannia elongata AG-77]|uniref:Uncharacterized protein n=1 Tax=Linnemannia elongata AG-77 TaxID=1314771 RepID=A0A197KF85_9FUNG|nr:hypothetical protein K457DRAFT_377087 [Linnemannia elongata AG-77]